VVFGAADGSHFNVPDLRGQLPLGLDNLGGAALANRVTASSLGGGDADLLGGDGGAEMHTLLTTQIPVHDHGKTLTAGALANSDESGATNTTSVKRSDFAVRSTGGDGAHNNMPPWIALNYLIYAQI
jgi:microcystin-dependent protein